MGIRANYATASVEQFEALQAHPERIWRFLWGGDDVDQPEDTANIDKAWLALNLFLSGHAWSSEGPFAAAILGNGEGFGPDQGMGQVNYRTPDEVRSIAAAFSEITVLDLIRRFDPEAYDDYDEGEVPVYDLDTLMWAYSQLKRLYVRAAQRGDLVLSYIG